MEQENIFTAITKGDNKKVEQYLIEGTDPNSKDLNNVLADRLALEYKNLDAFKLLLKYGCDLKYETTYLAYFAYDLYVFGDGGIDIEIADYLFQAIENNNIQAVKILLENGADINTKTINGIPLIEFVKTVGYTEIEKIIMNYQVVNKEI